MKSFAVFLCIGLLTVGQAQIILNGIVSDSDTKTPLSFVNIGIKNKNTGTSSQLNGTFSIKIPSQNENDTLTFSIVGYTSIHASIKQILSTNQTTFLLKVKANELNEIIIKTNALTEKKFGIKKENALIHFNDGSMNQNDIFEISQLIRFGTEQSKITSVNLLISESRKDSATFRINFYRFDGDRPDERIIEKSILQTKKIKAGWLKFDLSNNNIYLKGNFIAAIEFIPSQQKTTPIYYEVKLGGSTKSFVRSNSQGQWMQPPHHYKMHITALVEGKRSSKHEEIDEDAETAPTINMYSESVNDSFSVFVKLPDNYNTKKEKHFSAAYILDGNAYFDVMADEIRKQKKDIILIGIGYKNAYLMDSLRDRDYTFPKATQKDTMKVSGGAKQFLSFITTELIPYVDKNYRTDSSNRTLMGHSLGGFFTLFAMQQLSSDDKSYFKKYVSASPSVEYGDQYLIKQLQYLKTINPGTLIITAGENEMKEELSYKDSYNNYLKTINDKSFRNLSLISELFPNYWHMDTAIPTLIKGLKTIE